MKNLEPVYCPRCKLGFAPGTRFCPSCKIAFSPKDEEFGVPAEPVNLQEDVAILALLRTETAAWIRRLQKNLDDAGIPHRTTVAERRFHLLSLYVRPADFEEASRIDHEVYKLEVPGTEEVKHTADLDFTACPGCGDFLEDRDRECRSCGLRMAGKERRCLRCDEELEDEHERCARCGTKVS